MSCFPSCLPRHRLDLNRSDHQPSSRSYHGPSRGRWINIRHRAGVCAVLLLPRTAMDALDSLGLTLDQLKQILEDEQTSRVCGIFLWILQRADSHIGSIYAVSVDETQCRPEIDTLTHHQWSQSRSCTTTSCSRCESTLTIHCLFFVLNLTDLL